jgi:hypothetical protein
MHKSCQWIVRSKGNLPTTCPKPATVETVDIRNPDGIRVSTCEQHNATMHGVS